MINENCCLIVTWAFGTDAKCTEQLRFNKYIYPLKYTTVIHRYNSYKPPQIVKFINVFLDVDGCSTSRLCGKQCFVDFRHHSRRLCIVTIFYLSHKWIQNVRRNQGNSTSSPTSSRKTRSNCSRLSMSYEKEFTSDVCFRGETIEGKNRRQKVR